MLLDGIRAILRHDREFPVDWVLEEIRNGGLRVELLEDPPIGFLLYRVASEPDRSRSLYLSGAYGPGLGFRRLVGATDDLARRNHCQRVRIRVRRPGWRRVLAPFGFEPRPYYELQKEI